jgi:hypothetical protein
MLDYNSSDEKYLIRKVKSSRDRARMKKDKETPARESGNKRQGYEGN